MEMICETTFTINFIGTAICVVSIEGNSPTVSYGSFPFKQTVLYKPSGTNSEHPNFGFSAQIFLKGAETGIIIPLDGTVVPIVTGINIYGTFDDDIDLSGDALEFKPIGYSGEMEITNDFKQQDADNVFPMKVKIFFNQGI